MTRYDLRAQGLAAMLAALAGFTDAVGFLASGGYFVSFMSGNSTRAGVGLAEGARSGLIAAGLITCFVGGVTLGALTGAAAGRRRRPVLLGGVAALLAGGALLGLCGWTSAAMGAMALSMGAINNVFARAGEVTVGVTYMTGSLVKLGQKLAALLAGRDRQGWRAYLLLWGSFVAGVVTGGLAFAPLGVAGLLVPALAAAVLAVWPVLPMEPEAEAGAFAPRPR